MHCRPLDSNVYRQPLGETDFAWETYAYNQTEISKRAMEIFPESLAADRRSAILEVAAQLFGRMGFEGASIADIARGVGVTKPTLYHHFRDKDAIYAAVILDVLAGMYQYVHSRVMQEATLGRPRLKALMVAHAEFMEEYPMRFRAAHYGFHNLHDSTERAKVVELRDQYESMLREILADGIAAGHFSENDVPMMGRLVLASLNWLPRWHRHDGKHHARDIAIQFFELLCHGFDKNNHQ